MFGLFITLIVAVGAIVFWRLALSAKTDDSRMPCWIITVLFSIGLLICLPCFFVGQLTAISDQKQEYVSIRVEYQQ